MKRRLQQKPMHTPMGCSISFSPGWEVDAGGGTAGLCQPAERDIYDCYVTCFWPVPATTKPGMGVPAVPPRATRAETLTRRGVVVVNAWVGVES